MRLAEISRILGGTWEVGCCNGHLVTRWWRLRDGSTNEPLSAAPHRVCAGIHSCSHDKAPGTSTAEFALGFC